MQMWQKYMYIPLEFQDQKEAIHQYPFSSFANW